MGWKLTAGDTSFTDGDPSIDQWGRIERLTGESWLAVNPIRFMHHAAAVYAVLTGSDIPSGKVDIVGAKVVIGDRIWFEVYDDGDELPDEYENGIPPEGGDPTTSGSSGAPDDSDGPQS